MTTYCGEKVVYQSRSVKPNGQRRKWQWFFTADGKRHRYLNEALPRDKDGNAKAHVIDGLCHKCGHAYSHLMHGADQPCDECKIQSIAELGKHIEEEWGVNLGWGYLYHRHEPSSHNPEYIREQAHLSQKPGQSQQYYEGCSQLPHTKD